MLTIENNFFLSDDFRHLNEKIFGYEVIDTPINDKFFRIIFRKKKNSSKLRFLFSKSGVVSEFRGFFEIWGSQFSDEKELYLFLDILKKKIKIYNPGIIIFKNLFIPENFKNLFNKILLEKKFEIREWKTNILDLDSYKSNNSKIFHKKIKKDILKIKEKRPKIIKVDNYNDYKIFLKLFFSSEGHKNYPEQNNLLKKETWEIFKKHHQLFIIIEKMNYIGVFGIRIYKNLAALVMIGRNKFVKNSIHSFSINYLIQKLIQEDISFLDLTGFNPNPFNSKEEGIKFYKERFKGNIVDIPTYVKDNSYILKFLRRGINRIFKRSKLANENWIT